MNIQEKIDEIILLSVKEADEGHLLFTGRDDAKKYAEFIKKNIKAPYVSPTVSTLGGRPSILVKISLDKPNEWKNKIYENSRHFAFHIEPDPRKSNLEQFTKAHTIDKKFRKQKVKSVEDAVKKINKYIGTIK